jgi:hypothetical protein
LINLETAVELHGQGEIGVYEYVYEYERERFSPILLQIADDWSLAAEIRKRQAFIDPAGLVPVVNEVEGFRQQRSHSTVASTDARSAGGSQA